MHTSLNRIAFCLAAAALILAPAGARAANPHNPMQGVAVAGTSADGNVFKGTMDVLGFVDDGGVVKAIANLNGTLTSAAGAAQQIANALVLVPVNTAGATAGGLGGTGARPAAVPTAGTKASCNILNLDLGPLDLNLLGLNVHLDEVVLDITATPGAGNLLGNLLCAVANLLNGPNPGNIAGTALTNTLTTLLNNLLMAL